MCRTHVVLCAREGAGGGAQVCVVTELWIDMHLLLNIPICGHLYLHFSCSPPPPP